MVGVVEATSRALVLFLSPHASLLECVFCHCFCGVAVCVAKGDDHFHLELRENAGRSRRFIHGVIITMALYQRAAGELRNSPHRHVWRAGIRPSIKGLLFDSRESMAKRAWAVVRAP